MPALAPLYTLDHKRVVSLQPRGLDGTPFPLGDCDPCVSSLQEVEFDRWVQSSLPSPRPSTAVTDVACSLVDVVDRIERFMSDSEQTPPPSLASARVLFDSLHPCHAREVTVPSTQVTFADATDVVATALWDTGASYSIISKETAQTAIRWSSIDETDCWRTVFVLQEIMSPTPRMLMFAISRSP